MALLFVFERYQKHEKIPDTTTTMNNNNNNKYNLCSCSRNKRSNGVQDKTENYRMGISTPATSSCATICLFFMNLYTSFQTWGIGEEAKEKEILHKLGGSNPRCLDVSSLEIRSETN